MKKNKKLIFASVFALMLGATSMTAFAASAYQTPAEAVAGLTNRTTESVIAERFEQNKSYGTIASEAGALDEFKKEVLELKKAAFEERVKAGTMTQEEADEAVLKIQEAQQNCTGDGQGRGNQACTMNGQGKGGQGCGMKGQGRGLQDGTMNGQGSGAQGCGMGNGFGACINSGANQ